MTDQVRGVEVVVMHLLGRVQLPPALAAVPGPLRVTKEAAAPLSAEQLRLVHLEPHVLGHAAD